MELLSNKILTYCLDIVIVILTNNNNILRYIKMKNYNIQLTVSENKIKVLEDYLKKQEINIDSKKEVVDPFIGWSNWAPISNYSALPVQGIGLYCAIYTRTIDLTIQSDPMLRKVFYIGQTSAMYGRKGKVKNKGGLDKRLNMILSDFDGRKSSNHEGKFLNNKEKIVKNSRMRLPFDINNVYVSVRPFPMEYLNDMTSMLAYESRLTNQHLVTYGKYPVCSIYGR